MNDNIIPFPLQNKNVRSLAESEYLKKMYINQVLADLVPMIFDYLDNSNFNLFEDVEDYEDIIPRDFKQETLIVESIKSLLYSTEDIYHPFQKLAEEIFEETNELNKLKIADRLNIALVE